MNIAEEINIVKKEICEECSKSNPQLANINLPKVLLLASLVLHCGEFGNYKKSTMRSIACSVEMLNMAINYHYANSNKKREIVSNLNLITGDFLYARGIVYISKLCNGFYVSCLTQSINDIVKAEAKPKSFIEKDSIANYLLLRSSLFKTSAYLGGIASENDEQTVNNMSRIGKNFGMAYYLNLLASQGFIEKDLFSNLNKDINTELRENLSNLSQKNEAVKLDSFIKENLTGHNFFIREN